MFGRKKAVERKDLEFMRILVHLSARRVTDGVVQSEGRTRVLPSLQGWMRKQMER